MKGIKAVCVALVLLWVGCAENALAATIVYTDLSSWESAVAVLGYNSSTIDFENAARSTAGGIDTVSDGDVNFIAPGPSMLYVFETENAYGTGKALFFPYNSPTRVSLPDSVYAFGFNFGSNQANNVGGYLRYVELLTGETFGPYYGTYPDFAFFGVLSDDPITSLILRTGNNEFEAFIDNFTYAQKAAPVPEPASLLLVASGLIGVGAMMRKFKKLV